MFRMNPLTGMLDLVNSATAGTGDVTGPGSSDDKAIARFNGTTGKIIQNSPRTLVQDSGAINSQGFVTDRQVFGTVAVGSTQTWLAPSLEMQPSSIIQLASGAQLIII